MLYVVSLGLGMNLEEAHKLSDAILQTFMPRDWAYAKPSQNTEADSIKEFEKIVQARFG